MIELESSVFIQSPEGRPKALSGLTVRAVGALGYSMRMLVRASDQNLGLLKRQTKRGVWELLCQKAECGAQAKAQATPSYQARKQAFKMQQAGILSRTDGKGPSGRPSEKFHKLFLRMSPTIDTKRAQVCRVTDNICFVRV